MSDLTIRERIKQIQSELRDGALTPDMARESLVTLTALYGNVLEEVRGREVDYKRHLLDCYRREDTANRAKLVAETAPEYVLYREAQDALRVTLEMIRSLKQYMRSLDEEMRLSR